jgi:hypothetical protein
MITRSLPRHIYNVNGDGKKQPEPGTNAGPHRAQARVDGAKQQGLSPGLGDKGQVRQKFRAYQSLQGLAL